MNEQETPRYERVEDAVVTETAAPGGEGPERPRRSRWTAFLVAIGILAAVAFVAFFGLGGQSGVASQRNADNVEIIDINGTIQSAGETYNQSFIEKRIRIAQDDPHNSAILLLIDSPGGTVNESDETYLALMDYKEETGRPVYAYCGDYCASGGYYIASAADEIVADRNSFVGSIGVICGQFVDATGLLEKLGIDITTVHSGANKLMGSSYESPTEEQIAIYQTICDEIYDRFVGIVAESRGMSDADVRTLADGRIYSARQSLDNGLIDGIMSLEDFEEELREDLGDDITFYHEVYKQDTLDKIFNLLESALDTARASSSELASTMAAIEEMNVTEPMLLYQQAAE